MGHKWTIYRQLYKVISESDINQQTPILLQLDEQRAELMKSYNGTEEGLRGILNQNSAIKEEFNEHIRKLELVLQDLDASIAANGDASKTKSKKAKKKGNKKKKRDKKGSRANSPPPDADEVIPPPPPILRDGSPVVAPR